ncbi:hypothetical protein COM24_29040 [Bacillus toyonensis]|uniref:Amino acid transporter n=1 Tax=Bacillus toyonensis TaxID=155322 RepID=A0AAP8EY38_9BACI|nr:hypothetical protein [Bacillus toyonensis]KXY41429.1 amino acid transporter [Bacillus cereus]PEB90160.1 hypothetical protein CON81_26760 [Bacillus toyonensis]PEE26802.1 hypothetical protein CON98_28400 [Bacillus toyonensis]PEF77773.1 hypothetical protein CON80_29265 [Bacillus toyonensis]PEO72955.1 hypothetical protein CN570_29655 [Bacillus toyonensis]
MNDTIRIVLFTLVGISTVFSVIKEFQKPEKKKFWITFETLILIWIAWMLIGLLM